MLALGNHHPFASKQSTTASEKSYHQLLPNLTPGTTLLPHPL